MNHSLYTQTPSSNWTLEIVPAHADRVAVFRDLVEQIFITMIPGSTIEENQNALSVVVDAGFQPIPHIAARNFPDERSLDQYFGEIRRLGLSKALILAGGHKKPEGSFENSMDVLRTKAFRDSGLRSVAVAGHPEGNPEDPVALDSLKEKWDFLNELGLEMEIVTQWSFSPSKVDAYLANLTENGITAKVRVGVPGPASLKTLIKYAEVCGVDAAATVIRKQGFSMGRLLVSNKPDRFVSKISNTELFHLYPFGGLAKCADWLEAQVERRMVS